MVDQWEVSDGIPSSTVLSINQTPDGYLWIGTLKGLVRFDGVKFFTIPFSEKEKSYSQDIRNLFVDRKGTLWIGSEGGLMSYQYQTGTFKIYTKDHGITRDGIRFINDDMKGNLWISFTTSYVNRFSNGEFTAFNASHGLLGKKINAIIQDRQGNVLFGSSENGMFIYKDKKFSKYLIKNLGSVRINTMYEEREGALWIGTNKGLFKVTGKRAERYTALDGLTNDYIISITQDSDRNLWVATGRGLNRVKKKKDSTVGFENLLKSFEIMYLFEDREKSLWIGTDNSGIKRLKDGKFMSYAPFEEGFEEIPVSLFEDRHGDTWIGTVSGKLFHCRGSRVIESLNPPGLSGTGIVAIAEDAEGNLWLGTIGKGVFQKKNAAFTQFTTRNGLADNQVTSIYKDSRDNLWFSTFDGVSVLRYSNGSNRAIESLNSRNGLLGNRVHNVYEDKTQNIWIAADKGITVLRNGKLTKENIEFYLQGVSVTCIYEDVDSSALTGSTFWIATNGAGLIRLRQENFFSYTTTRGMTTNSIYQFFEDQQANFWLMSDSGILRVSKQDLNQFADGGTDRINCISYGISDGLKSLEFDNVFSRNSALKAKNGELRFITKNGISIVDPGKIRINKIPPPVVIEEVFFDDQHLLLPQDAEPVTFKGITNVSFHFTAPTFLSPEKVKFKYQLEKFDRDWNFLVPGQERVARYKDLAPGTYTFRVTACNAEGVWNQSGDSVTFTLKSLFYQTLLFKLTVLLLFIALAAAVFYLYNKKKQTFEQKEKYKGSPLHPDFAGECMKKLDYLVDIEKVYCDADITLQSLAEKMSIAPHLLSQFLNEKLNRNFADFISSYRIEEAKKILQTPRGARRKISAIAIEVGFSTMAAFYKAFKKHTGTTPTRYKKK